MKWIEPQGRRALAVLGLSALSGCGAPGRGRLARRHAAPAGRPSAARGGIGTSTARPSTSSRAAQTRAAAAAMKVLFQPDRPGRDGPRMYRPARWHHPRQIGVEGRALLLRAADGGALRRPGPDPGEAAARPFSPTAPARWGPRSRPGTDPDDVLGHRGEHRGAGRLTPTASRSKSVSGSRAPGRRG